MSVVYKPLCVITRQILKEYNDNNCIIAIPYQTKKARKIASHQRKRRDALKCDITHVGSVHKRGMRRT